MQTCLLHKRALGSALRDMYWTEPSKQKGVNLEGLGGWICFMSNFDFEKCHFASKSSLQLFLYWIFWPLTPTSRHLLAMRQQKIDSRNQKRHDFYEMRLWTRFQGTLEALFRKFLTLGSINNSNTGLAPHIFSKYHSAATFPNFF